TWNLARRRARPGSHERSSAGHGPVHPVTAAARPRTASTAGGADTSHRADTETAEPDAWSSSAAGGDTGTAAGAGPVTRPGHGPAGRSAGGRSPTGTRTTRSPGPRPPTSTGRVIP